MIWVNKMEIKGNLTITKNNVKRYKNLKSVGGDLYIHSNSNLKVPELKSVGGDLSIYSNSNLKAPELKSVGGDLYINSNSNLKAPELKSVGGYLYINSNSNLKVLKELYKTHQKNEWRLNENSPVWLRKLDFRKSIYFILGVEFDKELYLNVLGDKLSAQEVFAIENIEQRRLAYQYMDKRKMKELDNYKILDSKIDRYDNKMELVSFSLSGFDSPFKYLHCICPSTGREYFIETDKNKCEIAKSSSFGFNRLKFKEEW